MRQLLEVPLEEGGSILVEVESPEAVRAQGVMEKAQQSLEGALGKVRSMAASFVRELRGMPHPPDEVRVEFGLKFDTQAGAIIAATGMEGNFKITLTWTR